jgi:hypothetical protein
MGQWTGWGDWRFSGLAVNAIGRAQAINSFDRGQMQGSVCAFEFVKLGLKAIGSPDVFAKIHLDIQRRKTERLLPIIFWRSNIKKGRLRCLTNQPNMLSMLGSLV